MSTKNKKLSNTEIEQAFSEGSVPVVRQMLSTEEAAVLLGFKPKTINDWKNAGLLEGTYRQRQGHDRYWRDRLVAWFFNGPEWNAKTNKRKKSKPN